MPLEFATFTFIFTLAAVINGLGIVRWLTALAEYVRHKDFLRVKNYRIFLVFATYQFLLHVLLWWSMWAIRAAESFNFLDYLFLLTGPVLLFLSSSLLVPAADEEDIDLGRHFAKVRRPYAMTLGATWFWALLLSPVLIGSVPPSMPYHATFVVLAIVLRFVSRPAALGTLGALNWVMLVLLISRYAMELGGAVAQQL